MSTEPAVVSGRARKFGLAIALGVVLLMCAWQATRDDEAAMALPLTHAAKGATPVAHSNAAAQQRQLVARLERALASSAPGAAFPELTDTGRNAWASVVPPSARIATNAPVTAAATLPEFPFQWVGTLRQPSTGKEGADGQPVAIIAGSNSTRMVKQGDVVDEDWKIASLTAEQLQVIHLPSSSRQTITKNKQ